MGIDFSGVIGPLGEGVDDFGGGLAVALAVALPHPVFPVFALDDVDGVIRNVGAGQLPEEEDSLNPLGDLSFVASDAVAELASLIRQLGEALGNEDPKVVALPGEGLPELLAPRRVHFIELLVGCGRQFSPLFGAKLVLDGVQEGDHVVDAGAFQRLALQVVDRNLMAPDRSEEPHDVAHAELVVLPGPIEAERREHVDLAEVIPGAPVSQGAQQPMVGLQLGEHPLHRLYLRGDGIGRRASSELDHCRPEFTT